MESRDQGYNHWNLSGGIQYDVNLQTTVGVTGGYLWGKATQNLTDRTLVVCNSDFENSSSGEPSNKTNYAELYAAPDQSISEVNTTFLAGLTVSPAGKFNVRLLLFPEGKGQFLQHGCQ